MHRTARYYYKQKSLEKQLFWFQNKIENKRPVLMCKELQEVNKIRRNIMLVILLFIMIEFAVFSEVKLFFQAIYIYI